MEKLFRIDKNLVELSSVCLLSDACFIIEDKPTLFPSKGTRRPLPQGIDIGRELLAFCRWIVNASVILKSEEMMEEMKPFFKLLVDFFNAEWSRYTDRMRFQADESLFSQLAGIQDFLATFGALLVALETYQMVSVISSYCLLCRMTFLNHWELVLLVINRRGFMDVFQISYPRMMPWGGCGRFILLEIDSCVTRWPVFDWVLRFQWQRAVATGSLANFNHLAALEAISQSLHWAERFGFFHRSYDTICLGLSPSNIAYQQP